jgi:type IV pilus assembly protein PilN
MIRINLLGRSRPKAARQAVPLEATLQIVFLVTSLLVASGILYYDWYSTKQRSAEVRAHIQRQTGEKARLEQLKTQVELFDRQRGVLQQRINLIEELQRNRTGGQELLNAVANTVSRTDTLWLTSLSRKGNVLTIQGSAGSINAVANFITQLRRSGYFDQVEIKESLQDPAVTAVQMFTFTLTTQFALPSTTPTAPRATPAAATSVAPKVAPAVAAPVKKF